MNFPDRQINAVTILLLVVQLCLPLSGAASIADFLSTPAAGHSGMVCTHAAVDSDHESQDGHKQIHHCHELDAPCETTAGYALNHSPVITALASADKGVLLPGYGLLIDIPPENRV